MNRFDVIGFGALNVDTLLRVDRLAGAEEESCILDRSEACGGSAANTVVGLARLGCKVGFIGKVADDHDGKLQLDCFKAEGVNTEGITIMQQGRSGAVLGFVDRKGARALYVDTGVNGEIEPREINWQYVSQTQYLHLSSFVGEKSFRTQKKLMASMPNSMKISFDPGSVYVQRGFGAIEPMIQNSSVFMPNAGELEQLTGEADFRRGAEVILGLGVKIVAVKLGDKGCYVTDGTEKHTIEAFKVKVVDTTGAGDAFDAGFLYGLLKGKGLEECGRIGNFVASKCVTILGARAGLPKSEDLGQLL